MSLMSTGLSKEERCCSSSKSRKPTTHIRPITITVQVAAALSGLSTATIWNHLKSGLLPASQLGGRTLINFDAFEALLLKEGRVKKHMPNRWAAKDSDDVADEASTTA
jgi:predicted DNA-binding transcriptional regulator AlpA